MMLNKWYFEILYSIKSHVYIKKSFKNEHRIFANDNNPYKFKGSYWSFEVFTNFKRFRGN